jgi:hypothetical protein
VPVKASAKDKKIRIAAARIIRLDHLLLAPTRARTSTVASAVPTITADLTIANVIAVSEGEVMAILKRESISAFHS